MTKTIEHLNGCVKLPDHSLLLWEAKKLFASNDNNTNGQYAFSHENCSTSDFLSTRDAKNLLHRTIERIERRLSEEQGGAGRG